MKTRNSPHVFSHKENAELTERFSISENVRIIQDLPGVHRFVKLTVNEGFLAVINNQKAAFFTFSSLVNENHTTSKMRSLSLKIRHVEHRDELQVTLHCGILFNPPLPDTIGMTVL